ncbi:hypothetical protein F5888DRAFT_1800083 [Russula emetica]|nr:hypothetical protein F5888DRAFT_1800083 [Russula emetica]
MAITRHCINRADTRALMWSSFEETVKILMKPSHHAMLPYTSSSWPQSKFTERIFAYIALHSPVTVQRVQHFNMSRPHSTIMVVLPPPPAVPLTVANITIILTNISMLFTTVTVFQSLLFVIFPYEPRIQSGISAL